MRAFKGSDADKLLAKICEELGVERAENPGGFWRTGHRYLYKCGSATPLRHGGRVYERWQWHKPFGTLDERNGRDFVLLDTGREGPRDRYVVLLDREQVKNLIEMHPRTEKLIQIAFPPGLKQPRKPKPWQESFRSQKKPFAEFKREFTSDG